MSRYFRIPGYLPVRLREEGVDLSALLRSAGLAAGLFERPRMLVTTEELFALWRAIAQVAPDPTLGLRLATESNYAYFDPVCLAALSSGSFGEAIDRMAAYKQLSCPEEIVQETRDGEWSIQFRWLRADVVEPEILTDLCLAWVLTIAWWGVGTRLFPVRLEVMRAPKHGRTLEAHFACPVVFHAARNAIVFRATEAALPFVTRNAALLAMLAPQFDEELRQQKGQESFAERVRAAIQRKLAGRKPKVQEIAREMHLSCRTLQRRLKDDGLSFGEVLDEARHQLARRYLKDSLLELNETAYLLGYEDAGSFVRAFRGWEGMPPAVWRETTQVSGASA